MLNTCVYSGSDEHSWLLWIRKILLRSNTCLKCYVFKLIQQFESVQNIHEHRKNKELEVVRRESTATHNHRTTW